MVYTIKLIMVYTIKLNYTLFLEKPPQSLHLEDFIDRKIWSEHGIREIPINSEPNN